MAYLCLRKTSCDLGFMLYAENDKDLVSTLQEIAQSTIFTGVYSPEPEFDARILKRSEQSGNFRAW